MGFQDELVSGHLRNPLKSQEWMTEVVKHPEEEDQIEGPNPVRCKVHHVYIEIPNSRTERVAREFEAVLVAPVIFMPGELVRGYHARRATPLGFK